MTKQQILSLKRGDRIVAPWGEVFTLDSVPIERRPGRGIAGRGLVVDFDDGTGVVVAPGEERFWNVPR